MQSTKQVIFKVGNEEYGLDIMLVNAIEKYANIVSVPNSPECIKGIINLRGDVIPVYTLRKKFGHQEIQADDNTKLIVTKSKEILLAYEVDCVEEIIEIDEKSISEPPAIVRNESTTYMGGIANVEGRMILLLNHDGIISGEEKQDIMKMVEE